MANKRLTTILLILLGSASAAGADTPVGRTVADLADEYARRHRASVGIHAVRLADGKTLCGVHAGRPLIPASNQKVLTSAVALKRLGANFAFRTELAVVGHDVAVIGDGDPTTGDARLAAARGEDIYAVFDRWAATLKKHGLKGVGALMVRGGIFQPPGVHPDWPASQRQRWYSAPVAGVNFNTNCFDVGFKVAGRTVRPVVTPAAGGRIAVVSRVRRGKRHLWSCRFDAAGTTLTLRGTVTRTTPDAYPVAAPDPAGLFAAVLADRLERAGLPVTGDVLTSTDPAWSRPPAKQRRTVAVETTPLGDVLQRCNKQSVNMMAECLLLRSAVDGAKPADWKRAAKVATKVLVDHYGLKASQFKVADGSGYSRRNRVAPAAITHVLKVLASQRVFVRSLAVGGVDGSLKRRLAAARGRVLGKTGSLAGVSALSGYVLDRAGSPAVAFAILINGGVARAKAFEDRLCGILIEAVDAAPATAPATAPAARP